MDLTAYYKNHSKEHEFEREPSSLLSPPQDPKKSIRVFIKKAEMVNAKMSAFLQFDYDPELIAQIKQMPCSFWNCETRLWEIPEEDVPQLEMFAPAYAFDIQEIHYDKTIPKNFSFRVSPLPHQIEAINYGLNHPSFLNGDQPGLGKTYESLMVSEIRRQQEHLNHCLIICGVNSLQKNWQYEIETFTNQKARIVGERLTKKGTPKQSTTTDKLEDLDHIDDMPYYLIINIESLRNPEISTKLSDLCVSQINLIIFDECHKCKSANSAQGKGVLKLNSKYKIALSGTPITSSPLDLYFFMRWTGIEQRNYWQFSGYYQIFKKIIKKDTKKEITIPVGYQHLDEIQNKMDNFMIRRLKEDVLDLPEKLYKYEFLEMKPKQREVYERIYSHTIDKKEEIKEMPNPLVAFLRMRQCTDDASLVDETVDESVKLDRMEDIVEECIENNEKIIVFTSFHDVATKALKRLQRFKPAQALQETKDIEAEKAKFKKDSGVIVGTVGVLGTGHTLTEASTVLFLDQPWTYAELNQAEDRAHRIGQKNNVRYITLICTGTVDERVNEIINQKRDLSDMLIDKSKALTVDYLLKR